MTRTEKSTARINAEDWSELIDECGGAKIARFFQSMAEFKTADMVSVMHEFFESMDLPEPTRDEFDPNWLSHEAKIVYEVWESIDSHWSSMQAHRAKERANELQAAIDSKNTAAISRLLGVSPLMESVEVTT